MATTTYMNSTNFKNYTKFYQENNLTLDDDIIVVQDIPAEDMIKMDRLETLDKKIYPTEAEKTEMTSLKAELIDYMATSDKINKLNAMVYGMQVYLKEGVVIFFNQQKQELVDIVNNHKYMGVYAPLTTYVQGNMVMYNGYGFISKINGNIGNTPDKEAIDDGYWIRFTIKGDKGDPSLNISIKTNSTGGAEWDNVTVYNVGDACVYNHRLYYCLVNGTVGIVVTDTTKWACADKIWVGIDEPLDHSIIWWDTNVGQNVFKRYSDNNVWVSQNIKASDVTLVDSGNLYISNNVESALSEVMNKVNTIDLTASKVTVVDSANLYNGTNAETCFAEVMNKANSAFTSASNGKNAVAGVIGNLTINNTFGEVANEIQTDKNILATNLTNKGVSASNNDTLRNLVNLVSSITMQSLGGINFKSGTVTSSNPVTLNFTPQIVIVNSGGRLTILLSNVFGTGTPIGIWDVYNIGSATGSASNAVLYNFINKLPPAIYGGYIIGNTIYGSGTYWAFG